MSRKGSETTKSARKITINLHRDEETVDSMAKQFNNTPRYGRSSELLHKLK